MITTTNPRPNNRTTKRFVAAVLLAAATISSTAAVTTTVAAAPAQAQPSSTECAGLAATTGMTAGALVATLVTRSPSAVRLAKKLGFFSIDDAINYFKNCADPAGPHGGGKTPWNHGWRLPFPGA